VRSIISRQPASRASPRPTSKWRSWSHLAGRERSPLTLDHDALLKRLDAEALYLVIGLGRSWEGQCWVLVVGVHTVPDYEMEIGVADAS
jgi:hypothetical protein